MEPGRRQDEAVTAVVGVILMVAIAVLLAGLVFLLVSYIAGDTTQEPPAAAFRQDASGTGGVLEVVIAPTDGMDWSGMSIASASEATCMLPVGPVTAGDKVVCSTEGRLVLVYDGGRGQLTLYDGQIR